jgi:hypothetical protein
MRLKVPRTHILDYKSKAREVSTHRQRIPLGELRCGVSSQKVEPVLAKGLSVYDVLE